METIPNDFDLNLLRVLSALNKTRNVSQAARELGMSQSGFSTALARLRRKFNDPVFVRTQSGMEPTARALRMTQVADEVLAQVSRGILQAPSFDPATSSAEFRIAMSDLGELLVLPDLLRLLQAQAPGVRLSVNNWPASTLRDALEDGTFDMAVGFFPELEGHGLFRQRYYMHTYACLARADHPLIRGRITMEQYTSFGHVLLSSPARTHRFLEQHLEKQGIVRRCVLRTPHYLSIPSIVEATDLIATLPMAGCSLFMRHGNLQMLAAPFVPPSYPFDQHWHRRVHHDPGHKWLRTHFFQLLNQSDGKWRELEQEFYGKPAPARKAARGSKATKVK